ncbi:hypothetical protein [Flavobacterium aurantiibacter]|uniref:Lipoprotein n=1 Tax=Flavobacterium aurantiibacter TaxID=2023067 RepID=A0A256A286_9FLAO|nr:hypothetical protein [Flavobacterium aurantiibacter]OYQ47150.1 hypothetical protein CHX27_03570 [Flavobacterium aurantiibacter]
MKSKYLLITLLLLFIFSCNEKVANKENQQEFDIYVFMKNIKSSDIFPDSLVVLKIGRELTYKDSLTSPVPRFLLSKFGNIFSNNKRYAIVLDQGYPGSYLWFLETQSGFVKFYERDTMDASYIKDTIYDTNNDGIKELVVFQNPGGSGPTYRTIHYLNSKGLIEKEEQEWLDVYMH